MARRLKVSTVSEATGSPFLDDWTSLFQILKRLQNSYRVGLMRRKSTQAEAQAKIS